MSDSVDESAASSATPEVANDELSDTVQLSAPEPAGDASDSTKASEFTIMLVASVLFELPSPNPVLTLVEQSVPYRTLEIPVALPEAQAVAQAIYGIEGARPATHELFSSVLTETSTEIVAVRVTRVDHGVFYCELDLMTPRGRIIVDCRPTDAVILAIRQGVRAPILCDVEVFDS